MSARDPRRIPLPRPLTAEAPPPVTLTPGYPDPRRRRPSVTLIPAGRDPRSLPTAAPTGRYRPGQGHPGSCGKPAPPPLPGPSPAPSPTLPSLNLQGHPWTPLPNHPQSLGWTPIPVGLNPGDRPSLASSLPILDPLAPLDT